VPPYPCLPNSQKPKRFIHPRWIATASVSRGSAAGGLDRAGDPTADGSRRIFRQLAHVHTDWVELQGRYPCTIIQTGQGAFKAYSLSDCPAIDQGTWNNPFLFVFFAIYIWHVLV